MVAQRLKHLPGMRETWVQSLGWEDPLEKAMAPHSSTLAWKRAWKAAVHGIAEGRTRLSEFTGRPLAVMRHTIAMHFQSL